MTERNTGKSFVPDAVQEKPGQNRTPKRFVPDNSEQLNYAPDAVSGGETLDHQPAYSGLHLEALPLKGIRTFLYCLLALLVFMAGWQVVQLYREAMAWHWSLAAVFLLFIGVLLLSALKTLWHYLRGRENIAATQSLRTQASRLQDGLDFGRSDAFCEALSRYYHGKPQSVFLQRSLARLPDYSNAAEVIAHLEREFFVPLDQEAARRVSAYSLQTAVGVTLSPWTSVDMLIALWRNIRMADEIAQVYGIRPSLASRYQVLKNIAGHLVFVGVTEVAIDQYFDEIGAESLGSLLSARAFQGMGAGMYSVRIGIAAMRVCRPQAFSKASEPKFAAVAANMLTEVRRLLKRKI